jgi:FAD/FMN-containing dehydrogenase
MNASLPSSVPETAPTGQTEATPPLKPAASWGRYPQTRSSMQPMYWSCDRLPVVDGGRKMLPYGMGRSYGDCCLNEGGALVGTTAMNRIIDFDAESGLIRCEAGASLDEILQYIVPRGWFLPTTPGTRYITVGGAVANDVHGKNHHHAGTFGQHVRRFELLRSDGRRLLCSPQENSEWFAATIGGIGLTGLITWVEFSLRKIASAMIEMESVKFQNLDDFLNISAESDKNFEHTVAWVDCLASGNALGRGIFMRGNHAPASAGPLTAHQPPKLSVPFDFPAVALNTLSVKIFNGLYYGRIRRRLTRSVPHYGPFFYPLDSINHWNRIYGRRGFFQYQFVVPFSSDAAAIREIFGRIAQSGQGSFLAVLKTLGNLPSPGLMSFPSPGLTLALDFPNQGVRTLKLFDELDRVVLAAGGRFYPAKDARMSPECYLKSYPRWKAFSEFIDPAFSSSFWRRVTQSTV